MDTDPTTQTSTGGRASRWWALLAAFVVLAVGYWLWATAAHSQPRPDIFLITIDTLRADHLSCYGYDRPTSPNIDRFAQEAMRFERCQSHASDTRYSFGSILTGYLPHETGVLESKGMLAQELETLAEKLTAMGYVSQAVIANFVLKQGAGFEQGFMVYADETPSHELNRTGIREKVAEYTTDRSIELLKQVRHLYPDDPLFMWIHYQDPHGPYTPPSTHDVFQDLDMPPRLLKVNKGPDNNLSGLGGMPEYQQLHKHRDYHYYVAKHDGEIRYVDDQFGRLIEALKQMGYYDDAMIIFSSDHGEAMGEQNYYFSHSEHIYQSVTHVPLIIKYSNALTGIRKDFVQQVDILPTVLSALGAKVDSGLRGRDLRYPSKSHPDIFAAHRSWTELNDYRSSLIKGGLKLIHTSMKDQFELYDVVIDPLETNDLIDEIAYRQDAAELREAMLDIRNEDRVQIQTPNVPLNRTREEIEQLRDFGYTGD